MESKPQPKREPEQTTTIQNKKRKRSTDDMIKDNKDDDNDDCHEMIKKEDDEDEDDDEEEDDTIPQVELPSHARLTKKGGYIHTTTSRSKIGAANRGNVPWNKGKHRSEESKAKIGMAVRARNAALLQVNLQKINMSEQEYEKAKVDLKYMRERIRKIRIANVERIEKEKKENTILDNYFANQKIRTTTTTKTTRTTTNIDDQNNNNNNNNQNEMMMVKEYKNVRRDGDDRK